MSINLNINKVIDFVKQVSPNTQVLSASCKNGKQHLQFICECGKYFEKNWNTIVTQQKCLCNSCSKKDGWKKYRREKDFQEKFIQQFIEKGFTPLGEIQSKKQKVKCIDSMGYIGNISLENVLKGQHFSIFSLAFNEEFLLYNLNNFAKMNLLKTVVINYHKKKRSCDTIIDCICECGNPFSTKLGLFTTQRKWCCSVCTNSKSSLEKQTEIELQKMNISYVFQKRFDDCINPDTGYTLPFDFYCEEYNVCIEIDGGQHSRCAVFGGNPTKEEQEQELFIRQKHDKIKDEYCLTHDITLYRISFLAFHRQNQDYKYILHDIFQK